MHARKQIKPPLLSASLVARSQCLAGWRGRGHRVSRLPLRAHAYTCVSRPSDDICHLSHRSDLKSVVLHSIEMTNVKSTFPIAIGASINNIVDPHTYTATGAAFATVGVPASFYLIGPAEHHTRLRLTPTTDAYD